jgi:hypothetical protein
VHNVIRSQSKKNRFTVNVQHADYSVNADIKKDAAAKEAACMRPSGKNVISDHQAALHGASKTKKRPTDTERNACDWVSTETDRLRDRVKRCQLIARRRLANERLQQTLMHGENPEVSESSAFIPETRVQLRASRAIETRDSLLAVSQNHPNIIREDGKTPRSESTLQGQKVASTECKVSELRCKSRAEKRGRTPLSDVQSSDIDDSDFDPDYVVSDTDTDGNSSDDSDNEMAGSRKSRECTRTLPKKTEKSSRRQTEGGEHATAQLAVGSVDNSPVGTEVLGLTDSRNETAEGKSSRCLTVESQTVPLAVSSVDNSLVGAEVLSPTDSRNKMVGIEP